MGERYHELCAAGFDQLNIILSRVRGDGGDQGVPLPWHLALEIIFQHHLVVLLFIAHRLFDLRGKGGKGGPCQNVVHHCLVQFLHAPSEMFGLRTSMYFFLSFRNL